MTGLQLLLLDRKALNSIGIGMDFHVESLLLAIQQLQQEDHSSPRNFQEFMASFHNDLVQGFLRYIYILKYVLWFWCRRQLIGRQPFLLQSYISFGHASLSCMSTCLSITMCSCPCGTTLSATSNHQSKHTPPSTRFGPLCGDQCSIYSVNIVQSKCDDHLL